MIREIKFKALAPVYKGGKNGKLDWWYDVFTDGCEVYVYTKHMGLQPLKYFKALCQYTGLRDKNGKEVFEGDIVSIDIDDIPPYYTIGQIIYDAPAFALKNKKGTLESLELLLMNYKPEQVLEVIGNIYENPEVMKNENR